MRSASNRVQQMPSDQLPSAEAFGNNFNTFLDSLTANFTPLPAQPPGVFFTVPEYYLMYKSLWLVKSNKSSGPVPEMLWN